MSPQGKVHARRLKSPDALVGSVSETQLEFAAGGGVKPGIEKPVGSDNGGNAVGMLMGMLPLGSGIAVGNVNMGTLAGF